MPIRFCAGEQKRVSPGGELSAKVSHWTMRVSRDGERGPWERSCVGNRSPDDVTCPEAIIKIDGDTLDAFA